MKAGVETAIAQIRRYFHDHAILVAPSPCGGAYVVVEDVALGAPYRQATTWIGFFLTNACPEADTYPFFVRSDLSRIDGAALQTPLHRDHKFAENMAGITMRPAVMVSRRQKNQACWGRETPLIKLQTVLRWMLAL